MNKIGIIDADLISRKKHRFPNLACMKIAGYYHKNGHPVELLLNYDNVHLYDKVFISKVFTDTVMPDYILSLPNVQYGGTGFYYDNAEPLPYEIEHSMPYYDLYLDWVNDSLENGVKPKDLVSYTDYSIGFTTRGCFRKCEFCVNKKYDKVLKHSSVSEFLDINRRYICLLDDNVFGYSNWKDIFQELNSTGKKFQFKQGMDERLLTKEKCEILLNSNYIGDYMFAFDDIDDKDIIEEKLKIWNYVKTTKSNNTKFYVLCGFDRNGKYDEEFWKQDIINTFERIKILMKYKCIPYIMRYEKYNDSPYKGTYINLARWCNQPNFFKKKSYREFCEANQACKEILCSTFKYLKQLEEKYPEIASNYFDIKFDDMRCNDEQ